MRLFYIVFFFLFTLAIHAQDITSLNYGTSIAIDEDSSCPVNVNCIQAGRAVVLVNIYANGEFIEARKLKFYPSGFSNQDVTTLFNADGLRITGLNLMPYPIALSKTPKEDYFLELAIDY